MKVKQHFAAYYVLIIVVCLSRLLPHPPNFTPVGALGLFSGAYANRLMSWFAPLLALFISDLLIGLYSPIAMLMVYLGFIASILIGKVMLSGHRSVVNVASASLASAILFYLLSNFGVWLTGTLYPMTLSGFVACFAAAIPFFTYTLAGNLVFSLILFGAFEYMVKIGSNSRLPDTV